MHAEDPTRIVEEVFGRIWRERMADLPILNPALTVEAIGLQRWNGHWLGEYQTCSLFSPMDAFADQGEARATARASLAALLAPSPVAPRQLPERAAAPVPRLPPEGSAAAPRPAVPSRRRFLGLDA